MLELQPLLMQTSVIAMAIAMIPQTKRQDVLVLNSLLLSVT